MPAAYFVHYDMTVTGKRCKGFYEIDDEVAFNREAVVRDIAEGQFEEIDFVLCGDLETGSFRDVSGEIADEVMALLVESGRPLSRHMLNFMHEKHGFLATEEAIAASPFLHPDYAFYGRSIFSVRSAGHGA